MRLLLIVSAAFALTSCRGEESGAAMAASSPSSAALTPASVPAPMRVCHALHASIMIDPSPAVAADLRETCTASAIEVAYGPCHDYAVAAIALADAPADNDTLARTDAAMLECAA